MVLSLGAAAALAGVGDGGCAAAVVIGADAAVADAALTGSRE